MPASPDMAARLAERVVDIYAEAEATMLAIVARRAARGLPSPSWAEEKLADLGALVVDARKVVRAINRQLPGVLEGVMGEAFGDGADAAITDLVNARGEARTAFARANTSSIAAFITEAVTALQGAHVKMLRDVQDAYREVIAQGSAQVVVGVDTRREATQRALDRFADRGITGFRDSAGRNWELASYAEMATRTAAGNAAVNGHVQTLIENGATLGIISDAPEECALCRPWEGKVVKLVPGAEGDYPTLAEAIAKGLFHPNCRHDVGLYIEGLTPSYGGYGRTADPAGDRDRQRQRQLERHVRRWKRREAVAISPGERARAHAKVREWQAELRKFTEERGRKRLRYREQLPTGRPGRQGPTDLPPSPPGPIDEPDGPERPDMIEDDRLPDGVVAEAWGQRHRATRERPYRVINWPRGGSLSVEGYPKTLEEAWEIDRRLHAENPDARTAIVGDPEFDYSQLDLEDDPLPDPTAEQDVPEPELPIGDITLDTSFDATTTAGAEQQAIDRFGERTSADTARVFDYKGLDPRAANQMNQATELFARRFPTVWQRLQYVGTSAGLKKRMPSGIRISVTGRAYMYASKNFHSVAIMSNKFTRKKFDGVVRELLECVADGWSPEGCGTIASVTLHEFGHHVWFQLTRGDGNRRMLSTEIVEAVNEGLGFEALRVTPVGGITSNGPEGYKAWKEGLSRYSTTNNDELIAEAIAEYLSNPNPRPIALAIGRVLERRAKEML